MQLYLIDEDADSTDEDDAVLDEIYLSRTGLWAFLVGDIYFVGGSWLDGNPLYDEVEITHDD